MGGRLRGELVSDVSCLYFHTLVTRVMPALPSPSWSETSVKCKHLSGAWRVGAGGYTLAAAAAAIVANHHPVPGHLSARVPLRGTKLQG